MKKVLFMAALMLGFMVTSCNNADLADGQGKPATRAGQVTNLDLRDFGKVHNLIMDYGQSQLNQNSGIRPMSTDDEILVYDLNSAIKDNMANFLMNTSINSLSGDITDSMDDYMDFYGSYIDDHFLDPISDSEANGQHIDGSSILEQAYNCGACTQEEHDIIKKLALIALDTSNYNSLSSYHEEIKEVLSEWESIYGKAENFSIASEGFISGVCIQIGLYSSEWWASSYNPIVGNGPHRIAPWVINLARRDIRGAVRGTLVYLINCVNRCTPPTGEGAGSAALSGAVKGSLGGLFR